MGRWTKTLDQKEKCEKRRHFDAIYRRPEKRFLERGGGKKRLDCRARLWKKEDVLAGTVADFLAWGHGNNAAAPCL